MSTTMALPAKPFVSVNEAAVALGCTDSRVRQLLAAGEIVGIKLNERAWAVDPKSVREYGKRDIAVGRPRISDSDRKTG